MEDRLLPSPDLFIGGPPRIGSRPAHHNRADVHQAQAERGVRRPRAFLRAVKPQHGIHYFTAGGSAKLRGGDIMANSGLTAKGFDTDQSFMVVEIDGDVLRFQTISRRGKRVDSGEIRQGTTS
jgi:hypothetical protein